MTTVTTTRRRHVRVTPVTRRSQVLSLTEILALHAVTIGEKGGITYAVCPCGWHTTSDRPYEVRDRIQKHRHGKVKESMA